MFSTDDRHVRALRLQARSQDDVRRGAIVLEDALRTASFPGADGGRLVLIRKLSLGRISTRRGPAALSLQVESAFTSVAREAIHASHPGAAFANAVYFHDAIEPFTLLVEKLIHGTDVSSWYWPLSVPQFALRAGQALGQTLRGVVLAAAECNFAQMAVIEVVRAIANAGKRVNGGQVASSPLTPIGRLANASQMAALIDALGPADEGPISRALSAIDPPRRPRRPALQSSIRTAGEYPVSDDRASIDQLPEWKQRLLAIAGIDLDNEKVAASQELANKLGHWPVISESLAILKNPKIQSETPDSVTDPANTPSASDPPPIRLPFSSTQFAGLLFLLRPIERLISRGEFPDDFAAMLLQYIGLRLRLDVTDPMMKAIAPLLPSATMPPGDFSAPSAWWALRRQQGRLRLWRDGRSGPKILSQAGFPLAAWRGRMPNAIRANIVEREISIARRWIPTRPSAPASLLDSATFALRRWCRRYAGMGLGAIVRRPGHIHANATHLDIYLDLAAADVRIRRAGLDVNPGWSPKLGRVVQFHYERGGFAW